MLCDIKETLSDVSWDHWSWLTVRLGILTLGMEVNKSSIELLVVDEIILAAFWHDQVFVVHIVTLGRVSVKT